MEIKNDKAYLINKLAYILLFSNANDKTNINI